MDLIFKRSEFEAVVREQLSVFDRPLTEEDAAAVTHLDLSEFSFADEDIDILCLFRNLKSLSIEIGQTSAAFWRHFNYLEDLYLICLGNYVDFRYFENMKDLTSLVVSGGDYSGIDFLNSQALLPLKHLEELILHEFGHVDIQPLTSMPQLKNLGLHYADYVSNIEVIGTMAQLESLTLVDIEAEYLDFLDCLPNNLRLEMCGIRVYNTVDPKKWRRFAEHNISEITTADNPYEYIDLSELYA